MKTKLKMLALCTLALVLFFRAPYWSPVRLTAVWRDNIAHLIIGVICVPAAKIELEMKICDSTYGLWPSFHGTWMSEVTPFRERKEHVVDWKKMNQLIEAGNYEEVEGYVSAAISLYRQGGITEYTLNKVVKSTRGTQFKNRHFLDNWVSARPNSYLPYYVRGSIYFQEGWRVRGDDYASTISETQFRELKVLHRQALEDFKMSIQLEPAFSEVYVSVINLLKTYRKGESLDRWMKTALEHAPGSYYLHTQYLEHLLPIWSGSNEELYQYAVDQQGLASEYPMIRGLPAYAMWRQANLMDSKSQLNEKIQLYRKSLYHGPIGSSILSLARYLFYVDDYEAVQDSIDYAKEYLKHQPDNYWAHYYLARSYVRMRKPEKSREWLDKLVVLNPEFANTWSLAAEIEFELKNDKAVLGYVNRALELDEENQHAMYLRTLAMIRTKRADATDSAAAYFALCEKVGCEEKNLDYVRSWLEK